MFKYDLGDGADLRILEMRHAPIFLDFTAANRAYLGEWLGWANNIHSVEDAQNFIKRGMTRFAEDGLPSVGIWQDDQMVGGLLFFPIEKRILATEIGFWLGQEAAGHGLMTRSVRAMLGYVFDDIQLNRMSLKADVNNTRSRAVAERLGFTFEGIQRQAWINPDGDRFVDMATYAMLASDWQAQK